MQHCILMPTLVGFGIPLELVMGDKIYILVTGETCIVMGHFSSSFYLLIRSGVMEQGIWLDHVSYVIDIIIALGFLNTCIFCSSGFLLLGVLYNASNFLYSVIFCTHVY